MSISRLSLLVALAGTVTLGACTDPGRLGVSLDDPNRNTKQGAGIGAAAGALLGVLVSNDEDRTQGAITGAVVGGAIGAGIGYSLDQQAADLRADLANDDVKIENTGDRLIVTLPQDILFATDSSNVRSDLVRDLQALAGNLQAYPQSAVDIIGHTDWDGDALYNQALSERRANAVADVLLDAGVAFRRINAFGRGESEPVATNQTSEGRAQNRRVEIVIVPNT